MRIDGTTICFKSKPACFILELGSKKPNTLRVLNGPELDEFKKVKSSLTWISIEDIGTGISFERLLTDISHIDWFIGDGELYVFTWSK